MENRTKAFDQYEENFKLLYFQVFAAQASIHFGEQECFKLRNLLIDSALEICGHDRKTGSITKLFDAIGNYDILTRKACVFLAWFNPPKNTALWHNFRMKYDPNYRLEQCKF